ncbi:MAG: YjjG family noncanonical pyrimidine nucleotidase [Clostridiales bacterium]|nr:YjjG family noncanonical pyrimidine nucleotidase [Candidatus Equinaster intestinalis]
MKKYTTLLFDSDNTLLDFTRSEANGLRDTLAANNITYTEEIRALYSSINDSFWKSFERGEIKKEEIYTGRFKKLLDTLGVDCDAKKVALTYEDKLGSYHFLLDGAWETLEVLRSRGYDLHIVTNGNQKIQNRRLNDSGIINLVNKVFVSEAVGAPKPEKEYFDFVFANIKEKDKSKILIIGDSLTSDIKGGINAGIDTCFYNRKGKTSDVKPTYEIENITDLIKMLD